MDRNGELVGGSVRLGQKQTGSGSHPSCTYCGEPILPHEPLAPIEGDPVHHECGFRSAMGSVGHLRGECPHYGVEDVSEVGMTRRQAAKAAWAYFQTHKKQTGYQFGSP